MVTTRTRVLAAGTLLLIALGATACTPDAPVDGPTPTSAPTTAVSSAGPSTSAPGQFQEVKTPDYTTKIPAGWESMGDLGSSVDMFYRNPQEVDYYNENVAGDHVAVSPGLDLQTYTQTVMQAQTGMGFTCTTAATPAVDGEAASMVVCEGKDRGYRSTKIMTVHSGSFYNITVNAPLSQSKQQNIDTAQQIAAALHWSA